MDNRPNTNDTDNRPNAIVGLFGESTNIERAVAIRIIIEEDPQLDGDNSHDSSSEESSSETPLESLQNQIYDLRGKISDGENLNLNNSLLDLHRSQEHTNKMLTTIKKRKIELQNENERLKKKSRQLEDKNSKLEKQKKKDFDILIRYVESNCSDFGFMLKICNYLGTDFLQYASDVLKGDRDFMLAVRKMKGLEVLQYASDELQRDRDFMLATVTQHG